MSEPDEGGTPDSGAGSSYPPPPPPPPPDSAPVAPDYQPGPAYGYGGAPKTETTAIAAVVVAVVGLVLMPIILGVVALVLANVANKKIQESNGALTGQGLVTAARIVGIIDIVVAVIVIVVLIAD